MESSNRVDDSCGRARVCVIVLVAETVEFVVGGYRLPLVSLPSYNHFSKSSICDDHLFTYIPRHICKINPSFHLQKKNMICKIIEYLIF